MTGGGARISLPDALGLARVVAVPIVMALVLADGRITGAYALAAVIFALAGVTDYLDGYFARRWNITTVLGAFLDSTADKLLVAGALLALIAVERASVWVAIIIIGREIVVTAIRGIVALQGVEVAPSLWGKWKTAVQFGAIFFAMLRLGDPIGGIYFDEYLMWLAAGITVLSGWQYTRSFWDVVRSADSSAADRSN